MAIELTLIPPGTRVIQNGNGDRADIAGSSTRTFLCRMTITDQLEQESLDIAIWGSEDGENFPGKPLLKLPQRFYRGETRAVLDLTLHPQIKFIRASWELNRWGRVAPTPMFVVGLQLTEVPAMPKRPGMEKLLASA